MSKDEPTMPARSPGSDPGAPNAAVEPPQDRAPHHREPPPNPASPGDELGFDIPPPARLSASRAIVLGLIAAAVLGVAFVVGWLPRRQARASLEASAASAEAGKLRVEVVASKVGASDRALVLPGSVQPLQETTVYARADGYVRRWHVDIGDVVTEGKLLAELDTPELDQQIDQARAQLAQAQAAIVQAKANRDFSAMNLTRYKTLTEQGLSAPADLDQRKAQAQVDEANVTVAQANANAQDANLRRLAQLRAFSRVTAPFAGTITARSIEIGSLVTASNAAPLFKIAAMDPARVFVQVPQDVAPGVRAGVEAKVKVREYPGRSFAGKVTRAAEELDPTTRTMTTEVRIGNGDGALIAGMYAEVALSLPVAHRVITIPPTALMNDAAGQRVAVVGEDDRLRIVPVVVERDNGASIDLASGLAGGERVVKLGGPELTEGRPVAVER
jgi:RND family efflux transporter MFP subunit